MGTDKTWDQLLEGAAKSGKPLNVTHGLFKLKIYVTTEDPAPPDPHDYRVHPLALGRQLDTRARSVGR